AMIPESHPLASVRGAFNAVFVESHAAGELMFYGPGAGGSPTASAVLGDVVSVARNRVAGVSGPAVATHAQLDVLSIGDVHTRYHISLDVDDRPGVLAAVAQAFAQESVSIKTVLQDGHGGDRKSTRLNSSHVFPTRRCSDLVSVARNRVAGVSGPAVATHAQLDVLSIGDVHTRYHISLDVDDRPGVLAAVAQAFAQESVSIKTVLQDGHG